MNLTEAEHDAFSVMAINQYTPGQKALIMKYGTPSQFSRICYLAVGEISMDEAQAAIEKYVNEFTAA